MWVPRLDGSETLFQPSNTLQHLKVSCCECPSHRASSPCCLNSHGSVPSPFWPVPSPQRSPSLLLAPSVLHPFIQGPGGLRAAETVELDFVSCSFVCFVLFCLRGTTSSSPGWPGTHYVVGQAGLELSPSFLCPSECWISAQHPHITQGCNCGFEEEEQGLRVKSLLAISALAGIQERNFLFCCLMWKVGDACLMNIKVPS